MYWIRSYRYFKERCKALFSLVPVKELLPLRWQNLRGATLLGFQNANIKAWESCWAGGLPIPLPLSYSRPETVWCCA